MANQDPELLSTSTAYEGRLFNIEVSELQMPDGVRTLREIIRHPGAVGMIPVTDSGEILFVTQYRHASGGRLLELPAGTLEPGEEPLAAAIRELQEEVGFRPGKTEALGGFYVAPGYSSEFIHLYLCTELVSSVLEGDADEDIEVERRTVSQALAAVESGEICDAKSVIGVLRYARMQRED